MRGKRTAWVTMLAALVCLAAAGKSVAAQQQGQKPAQQQPQKPTDTNNAFPTDTSNVPVVPSNGTAAAPNAPNAAPPALPAADDADPVRSPDDAGSAAEIGNASSSSSSSSSNSDAGMGRFLPGADDDTPDTTETGKHRRGEKVQPPEHQETAKEDISVGDYYLSTHDWKGALSRYQSALVLSPETPDVYWGLAEAQRHMGDLADAKANYEKLLLYDPDNKHAKDARKILKDPEIANAQAAKPSAIQR